MNNKLPVEIDNMELPVDNFKKLDTKKNNSYGYVSFLYLASLIITLCSVVTIVILGR